MSTDSQNLRALARGAVNPAGGDLNPSPQPESPEPLDEFKELRAATKEVLWPIGNLVDRHTAVMRTMERRLAFQKAASPYVINKLLTRLSDAEAAIQAARNEAEAMRAKAARYDWLKLNAPDAHMWNDESIDAAMKGDAHA